MTKIELKNYLETFYGMRVKKVHTAIMPSREKRHFGQQKYIARKRIPAIKKAFVYVKEDITLPWTEEVKKEILRYYDRKLNKKLALEAQKAKIKDMQQKQKTAQAGGTPK
jgi:ribosomal protein L23